MKKKISREEAIRCACTIVKGYTIEAFNYYTNHLVASAANTQSYEKTKQLDKLKSMKDNVIKRMLCNLENDLSVKLDMLKERKY